MPKHKVTPSSGDSDTESDDAEQFTKKFMRHVKKSDDSKLQVQKEAKIHHLKIKQDKNVPTNSRIERSSSDEDSSEDELDIDTDETVSSAEDEEDIGQDSSEGESGEKSGSDEDSSDESEKEMPIEESYAKLRKELADLPFGDLQKLKEQIGVKVYNSVMFGSASDSGPGKKKVFHRDNKNRPSEVSSKRPVSRFREVVQVKKKLSRDPRFDDLSGEYSDTFFKKSYSFIDDLKNKEKKELHLAYKQEEDPSRKKKIASLLKRMEQQEKLGREMDAQNSWKQEWKRKEQELVKQGKKPFYPKKAEMKKMVLAEKFKELKKSGKVDKYLARKRKKVAAKDRKLLPNKQLSRF